MNNLMRWPAVDIPDHIRRFLEGDTGSWLRLEEYRDGNFMVVKAEVPGIDPEKDVDITLSGDELTIEVSHQEKSEHKDKHGYRSEFRYGTFSRTVTLPGAVQEEDIQAAYTDGILEVRIPVAERDENRSRKIPVTRKVSDAGRGTSAGEGGTGETTGPGPEL